MGDNPEKHRTQRRHTTQNKDEQHASVKRNNIERSLENKRKRKPKGKSRMDNPEKLTTLGT
jgi:hypothetical protein